MKPAATALGGHLMVAFAALLWSTVGLFGRWLGGQGMAPVEMTFWRALVMVVLSGLYLAVARPSLLRLRLADLPGLALYGAASVGLFQLSYFWAIKLNTVALAAILLYTAPFYVVLLAVPCLGERLRGRTMAGLLLAFLGLLLVTGVFGGGGRVTAAGILAGLIAGFTYATLSLGGKRLVRRHQPLTLSFYSFVFGLLFLSLFSPLRLTQVSRYSPFTWLMILGVGVLPTLLAYLFYYQALTRIHASAASITANLEPVAASLLGYLVLGETLTGVQVVGAGLVIAAVTLINLSAS